jgi:thymidylate synthase ThyX
MSLYLTAEYGDGGIYAKVVCASRNRGVKLLTLETRAPKHIDAEFEKHRMLSSNSSSSRAVPFGALGDVYLPIDVRAAQAGMQGYEPATIASRTEFDAVASSLYGTAIDALLPFKSRIHKQHLNRYIEPWMYQTKVVTATEWDNFFQLRLAPDAQPEIQELARCMRRAIDALHPDDYEPLGPGAWHLPYVTEEIPLEDAKKCSAARCARTSYRNHDRSNPVVEKDIELFDFLLSSMHMTPFEHQAAPMEYLSELTTPMHASWESLWEDGITHRDRHGRFWSGNFRGFIQHRQLLQGWNL